jgi:hypothetical protein
MLIWSRKPKKSLYVLTGMIYSFVLSSWNCSHGQESAKQRKARLGIHCDSLSHAVALIPDQEHGRQNQSRHRII